MREDCRHFAARIYDDGETARFCTLDLAPEAPWRCPENCAHYERTLVDATFEQGSLARPEVESEPLEETPDDIGDLLDDAEAIVESAAPEIIRELDAQDKKSRRWWRRGKKRRDDGDDDWHLSNR